MPIRSLKATVNTPAVVDSPRAKQEGIQVNFANGQKHRIVRLADGAYAIVAPPSGEVTIESVDPAKETLEGGRVINGAMIDPEFETFGTTGQGIDSGLNSGFFPFNSAVSVDFPVTLQVGQVLVCAKSHRIYDNPRYGLCESYAGFHIVASQPTETTFSVPAVKWTGRTATPQGEDIDVGAFVDTLPSYSATGQNPPSFENIIHRIERYAPLASVHGNQPNYYRAYQEALPRNYSQGLGETIQGNHGQYAARTTSAACLALISDAFDRDQKIRIATALISAGIQWGDPVFNGGASLPSNGGHMQWFQGAIAIARAARGLDLSDFMARAGGNWRMAFQVTQEDIDRFQPHNRLQYYSTMSRERLILDVNGTSINVAVDYGGYQTGLADAGSYDLGHNSFLVCAAKGISARASGFFWNDTKKTDVWGTIGAQPDPPFEVGDIVYFQPPYTLQVGQFDWATRVPGPDHDCVSYTPSANDFYRNQQDWAGQLMLVLAAGWLDADPDFFKAVGYTKLAMTPDAPDPSADYAPVGLNWEQQFFAEHGATLFP